MTMPKYEVYKDSGVDWLGNIPNCWTVKRIKFLFNEVNVRSKSGEEVLLSLSKYKGVIRKDSLDERAGGAASHIGYKMVYKDHLVINKMQAVNGLLAVSSLCGITSPDYSVYKIKDNDLADIHYLNYLLLQPEYLAEFKRRVTGVMEGFIRLYTDDLYDIKAILPPFETQKEIVNFLDKKTAQIDEAIAIKKEQIELLKERKQVIIQQSVTQGLNSDAPMKSSGVKWLGKIPSHWEVERSQWVFEQRRERARQDDEQLTASQKYGVISQKKYMEIEGRKVTQVEFNAEILKHVEKNDFVISMRSFQGGIEYCPYIGCVSSAYVPLIPGKEVYSPYFKYLLKSRRYIEALQSTSNLVRDGQALRYDNFCMVALPIVPIKEQIEIANFIEKQSQLTEQSIELQLKQIEKLKEYKTTLINSVVTGKIKVPGVA